MTTSKKLSTANPEIFKFSRASDYVVWRKSPSLSGALDVRLCDYSSLDFFSEVFEYWRAFCKENPIRQGWSPHYIIEDGEFDFVVWLAEQAPPFNIEYIGPEIKSNDPPGVVY